jgi:hypothetical protein
MVHKLLISSIVAVALAGCAVQPQQAPVATSFTFVPPATTATKNSVSLAIVYPEKKGYLTSTRQDMASVFVSFLDSAKADIEKVMTAKGFTSAGIYSSLDEMTFPQKERSSLVLKPEISVEWNIQRGGLGAPSQATMSGYVRFYFIEPMTKEKIEVKGFDLPPISRTVQVGPVRRADGKFETNANGQIVSDISRNSAVDLLNSFYASAFEKIWAQLDAREIVMMKTHADKLKSRSSYRAN